MITHSFTTHVQISLNLFAAEAGHPHWVIMVYLYPVTLTSQ